MMGREAVMMRSSRDVVAFSGDIIAFVEGECFCSAGKGVDFCSEVSGERFCSPANRERFCSPANRERFCSPANGAPFRSAAAPNELSFALLASRDLDSVDPKAAFLIALGFTTPPSPARTFFRTSLGFTDVCAVGLDSSTLT